jgi:hypothetical protein
MYEYCIYVLCNIYYGLSWNLTVVCSKIDLVRIMYVFIFVCVGRDCRYSDWLRAGRPRVLSSSPCSVKNFHFYISSRSFLGSTQPPIQWVPGTLSPGVKAAREWNWPLNFQLVSRSRKSGSIRPLPHTPPWRSTKSSTGTSLPFLFKWSW